MGSPWDSPELVSFANHIKPDWDEAIGAFFRAVERKAAARGVTSADITAALSLGYGETVEDCWFEWTDES